MAIQKEKLLLILTFIESCNDKFFTQKRQICYSSQEMFQNPTVNLGAHWNSSAKIACRSSELIFMFPYGGSGICNSPRGFNFFLWFAPHSTPQIYLTLLRRGGSRTVRARFKKFYQANHSEVDTCSNELFFSQWPIFYLPKYWLFLIHHPVQRDYTASNYGRRIKCKHKVSPIQDKQDDTERRFSEYLSFFLWKSFP